MFDHPLRLAVGSHSAGSGYGCAMNMVSWENGDTFITDLPRCSDFGLSNVVQGVNDLFCCHATKEWYTALSGNEREVKVLCAECSVKVLALAHRTVGTNLFDFITNLHQVDHYAAIWQTIIEDVAGKPFAEMTDKYPVEVKSFKTVRTSMNYESAVDSDLLFERLQTLGYCANKILYRDFRATHPIWAVDALLERGHQVVDAFYKYTGLVEKSAPDATIVEQAYEKLLVQVQ